jgi:hypothetical protein
MAKTRSKTKRRNPKGGKVLYNGRYLVGRQSPRGMVITATEEGREEASEAVGTAKAQNVFFDMFEDWIGNGWTWIPPEAIGALTDGEIISPDAFIEDDGSIAFDTEKPRIYWFSDYQVVDPLERWSEGEGITFDLSKMENNPSGYEVDDIIAVLESDRDFAIGGDDVEDVAREWTEENFSASEVRAWLDARAFSGTAAASMKAKGITPAMAKKRVGPEVGIGGYTDTIGYKVSNGDLSVAKAAALARTKNPADRWARSTADRLARGVSR